MPLKIGTKLVNLPIKRVYLGEILKYKKVEEIKFTSNIIPIIGSNNSGSNEYGVWTVTSGGYSTYKEYLAFDRNDSTRWRSVGLASDTATNYLQVNCPCPIKPAQIRVLASLISNRSQESRLQGYNEEASEWENLGSISRISTTAKATVFSISVDKFYTKFRCLCYRYGSTGYNTPEIYSFELAQGTIKK